MDTNIHKECKCEDTIPYIQVDKPETWPAEVIKLLNDNKEKILQYNNFSSDHEDCDIPDEIQNICKDRHIVGYHYTKEFERGYFEKNGLKPLTLKHIDWVLDSTYSMFSADERDEIQKKFKQRFDNSRSEKIYFVTERHDLDHTLMNFTRFFGGECLLACFDEVKDRTIANKLEKIGLGVIIQFVIPIKAIQCSSWGISILTNWARTLNPSYKKFYTEGFVKNVILPEDILMVVYLE